MCDHTERMLDGRCAFCGRTDDGQDILGTLEDALDWYEDDRIECARLEKRKPCPVTLRKIDAAREWLLGWPR